MGWLGLDDTDGLSGGCTTHTFHKLISLLAKDTNAAGEDWKWRVSSNPRLVRLWPFAERRTRGNAAVACEIILFGEEDAMIDEGRVNESETALLKRLDELWKGVVLADAERYGGASESHHDQRQQSEASPGMLWLKQDIDNKKYTMVVRGEVKLTDIMEYIDDNINATGGKVWKNNGGHGCIGALAAISWSGAVDHTWEAIAYRLEKNIGTPRFINNQKVIQLTTKFPDTFVNRDPTIDRSLISPRTPCPVLFGIRAETRDAADSAARWLLKDRNSENASSMRVWQTNQATNDHLFHRYKGALVEKPQIIKGGHAIIELENDLKAIAFSQSGDINSVIQMLISGDEVEFCGIIPKGENIVHLERFVFKAPSPKRRLRPLCDCGSRFTSKGKGQQLKCPNCKEKIFDHWVESPLPAELAPLLGVWVEPPASARRHLAAPLSRLHPDSPSRRASFIHNITD
ncbi:MAG: DUF1743 domain-containing protein [Euryarchaeota archaeon]|nr:DUF1743 domain-containing protein [Euryarchaeota archaeon]